MSDLIKREDAIKVTWQEPSYTDAINALTEVREGIKDIPSAEPEKVCIGVIHFDDEKLHEIANEAVKKVKEEIEPKWIPCSERLPNIGEHHISEPCIVYCKNGVYAFAELEENIFGQVGWNCERDDDYHEPIGEVVAWMPLPEWEGEDDDL